MKIPLNFQLSIAFLPLFCCFVFMNAGCAIQEGELASPEVEAKTSAPNAKFFNNAPTPVDWIKVFTAAYDLEQCNLAQGYCVSEQKAFDNAEQLAFFRFPIPPVPWPCSPIGHCFDFGDFETISYPYNDKYKITIRDSKTYKLIAINYPGKEYQCSSGQGYVCSDLKFFSTKGFSGKAVLKLQKLNTQQSFYLKWSPN